MDNDAYSRYSEAIKPWKIDSVIGEGAFGIVFRVSLEEFGHTYKAALKAITIPQTKSEVKSIMADGMDKMSVTDYYRGFVSEITKECALMSRFKGNSNVVSYEDHRVIEHTDDIGWDIFIRMELLTPLIEYEQSHKMTEKDIIKLGIDMCKALEICENNNVIHRDIKPENIFVSNDGNFKLGDFGIARTIEKTTGGLSKTGTTSYMAPEVYKGEDYDFTVDIYSLGMVMYRYLNNNRTPFLPPSPQPITYRDKENARIMRMKGEKLPRPCNGSDTLIEVILKACSYDSDKRFRNAAEMRHALEMLSSKDAVAETSKFSQVTNSKKASNVTEMTESIFEESDTVAEHDEKTTSIFSESVESNIVQLKRQATNSVNKQYDDFSLKQILKSKNTVIDIGCFFLCVISIILLIVADDCGANFGNTVFRIGSNYRKLLIVYDFGGISLVLFAFLYNKKDSLSICCLF